METSRVITADYLIETAHPLEAAAAVISGEQSCGTFVRTPGETDELRAAHAAHIESIEELEMRPSPALPGSRPPSGMKDPVYRRARIRLSWPLANVGYNLPNLMSTLAGNLFELSPFSALRLLDFDLPPGFADHFQGPAFGMEGTRDLCSVEGRPILGTIIKPSVGLTPAQTAAQVKTLVEAGLDFIKDDELMGDPPYAPFEQRVDAVMEVLYRHADATGRMPMYAFNLSGEADDMMRRHDYLFAKEATCAMVNLNWVGITGLLQFRKHCQLPIHGHRNGWGLYSRSPDIGMAFPAYGKIWRLCGADHLHTNGLRNKFCEPDADVIEAVKSCLTPWLGGFEVAPVLSSGQWADQAYDTWQAIGSPDLLHLCGGGITAHPGGMAAGVASLRIAWEGAMNGKTLSDLAPHHPEIQQAIDFFRK